MYSASINEDCYAEAGVVSKGSVRHVTERIGRDAVSNTRLPLDSLTKAIDKNS